MTVDWLSASGMLLSGLIIGFMFIYGMRRKSATTDLERKDLEAKRDALIAQLRTETDPAERKRLEIDAANVLKKLDGLGAVAGDPARQAAAGEVARHHTKSGAVAGFFWGAGSVAALVAIGFFVWQSAKPKEQQPAQQQQADDPVKQLEATVQRDPSNLNARNELAKAYLDRENVNGVVEQTNYVLQHSPDDARALTYQALVRVANGDAANAKTMLDHATKSDPNLIDAWVGLAWVAAQQGNVSGAQAAIDEAKRRHPDQAERLDALMQHLKPATPVKITINVASGAKVPDGAVIYVIARAAGQTAGQPIAVKRLALGAFPMTTEISAADSMTGQPLPQKLHIDVRVDSDGNPLTKSPGDLVAAKDDVAAGQSIELTVK